MTTQMNPANSEPGGAGGAVRCIAESMSASAFDDVNLGHFISCQVFTIW